MGRQQQQLRLPLGTHDHHRSSPPSHLHDACGAREKNVLLPPPQQQQEGLNRTTTTHEDIRNGLLTVRENHWPYDEADGELGGIEHATDLLGDWDCGFDFDFGAGDGQTFAIGVGGVGSSGGIGDKIPGYRTSAAFLSTLRQNLALTSALPPPSPTSTASTMPTPPSIPSNASSHHLPPPSPLSRSETLSPPPSSSSSLSIPTTTASLSDLPSSSPRTRRTPTPPTDDHALAHVPELTTYVTHDVDEKRAALRLVADAVAQDRQLASSILIAHPYTLALLVLVLAVAYQLLRQLPSYSLALFATTSFGIVMALLIGVRYLAGPYLVLAEGVGWEWLEQDGSEVVVMRFGENVIGTVVLAVVSEGGKGKKKRKRGILRAWTVRRRERGRGCGRGLIEEGVRVLGARGVEGVGWEEGGIYSKRVLPDAFNRKFDEREELAKRVLEEVCREQGIGGKKR